MISSAVNLVALMLKWEVRGRPNMREIQEGTFRSFSYQLSHWDLLNFSICSQGLLACKVWDIGSWVMLYFWTWFRGDVPIDTSRIRNGINSRYRGRRFRTWSWRYSFLFDEWDIGPPFLQFLSSWYAPYWRSFHERRTA